MSISVDDIYIMTYLMTKGYKHSGVVMQSNRLRLTFEDKKVQSEISNYYAGDKVSAISFVENFRNVKDIIFEESMKIKGETI